MLYTPIRMSSSLSISNDAARMTTRAVRGTHCDGRPCGARCRDALDHGSAKPQKSPRTRSVRGFLGLLPLDVVIAHVLRNVLTRGPRGASRGEQGMREAVDATERKIEELDEDTAAERGCLSTLLCSLRRGRLRNRVLC